MILKSILLRLIIFAKERCEYRDGINTSKINIVLINIIVKSTSTGIMAEGMCAR